MSHINETENVNFVMDIFIISCGSTQINILK